MASPLVKRLFFCKGNPWVLWKLHDHTPCQRGKPKKWIINKKYNGGTSPGRGENQREKSKVPPASEPYYTMLDYSQGHHSVHTDPALHGSLTNPGSLNNPGSFDWPWIPEANVEWISNMRVEQSLGRSGVEFQPRGRVESGTAEVWDGASPDTRPHRSPTGWLGTRAVPILYVRQCVGLYRNVKIFWLGSFSRKKQIWGG